MPKQKLIANENEKDRFSEFQHFCNPPPAKYDHLFEMISTVFLDEIDAHMRLFEDINDYHYKNIVTLTIHELTRFTGIEV